MRNASLLLGLAASAAFATPALRADPGALWVKNCAACHGKDGAGHTKAGRMAGVKDMTDAQYQKTFTDADAAARIKGGLKEKNGKVRMKPFGDVLSADDIQALVAHVRSLAK